MNLTELSPDEARLIELVRALGPVRYQHWKIKGLKKRALTTRQAENLERAFRLLCAEVSDRNHDIQALVGDITLPEPRAIGGAG